MRRLKKYLVDTAVGFPKYVENNRYLKGANIKSLPYKLRILRLTSQASSVQRFCLFCFVLKLRQ